MSEAYNNYSIPSSLNKSLKRLVRVLCIVFFFILNKVDAQDKKQIDSTYIESFADKMVVKLNLDTSTNEFRYFSNDGTELILEANNALRLDLSLDYEIIGLSIGFAPSFFGANSDDERKGETTFSSFGLRFFLGNWIQNLNYRNVQGYYIKNTGDFIPGWDVADDPFLQIPSLKSILWGGSTAYVFNPNFSFKNIAYNTEWQLKSSGSFVPTLRYGYNRLSFIDNGVKEFENDFSIGLIAAYHYTWVLNRNWFISPELAPGIAIRFTNSGRSDLSQRETETNIPFILDGGLNLGFSSKRIVFGGLVRFRSTYLQAESGSSILEDQVYAKVYFGYRFDPPGFIDRTMKKLNTKLGL